MHGSMHVLTSKHTIQACMMPKQITPSHKEKGLLTIECLLGELDHECS